MSMPTVRGARATSRACSLADLMQRYVAGDPRAFRVLHAEIEPHIRRQIRARVANDDATDEIVQVTLLRAHAARTTYRRPLDDADDALVAWYCAIARNCASNYLRSTYRDRLQFGESAERTVERAASIVPDTEQLVVGHEVEAARRAELLAAIAALPPGQRVVVTLHKLDGLPFAEVSRRLGVRHGAVRVRAHRAYESLRNNVAAVRRVRAVEQAA